MNFFRTLFAGGLGWVLGGPIGAIIGMGASALFSSDTGDESYSRTEPRRQAGGDYLVSLLVLIAAVMKADNKVKRSELDYVKTFLRQTFGEAKAKESLILLKDILKQNIPINDVCHQINRHINREARMQMIHLLFGLALADGHISKEEESLIFKIALQFNLTNQEYISIKSMFIQDSNWAYKVLEIEQNATDQDVHKAFKKMAIKYHPDKVADQGEDIVKAANKKFQKLNEAYQTIKKERNL
ncbi:TerB family tellurite resistance protein [Halosquirtibacter laminarini]|uniref:TerB family tellurite resistance protein n=1 Tax=Halosquirtibacter laminarini TaxID=3374600 RepID=A0AC61NIL3_9BACT|nr:TerB family tellurite resistance protein [Prolixibacteraceae bacterium]